MTKEEAIKDLMVNPNLDNYLEKTLASVSFSAGWDACSEYWEDKIKAAFYNGHIDPFAAKLLLGDVPHPVDEGRKQAKEKH